MLPLRKHRLTTTVPMPLGSPPVPRDLIRFVQLHNRDINYYMDHNGDGENRGNIPEQYHAWTISEGWLDHHDS